MAIRIETTHLIEKLIRLSENLKEVEKVLEQRVDEHPDGAIFRSLPVKATATTATLMAAFGEQRDQAPSWQELAAHAGMAPVKVAFGQSRHVKQRRACDQVFRHGFQFFAFNTAFIKTCWASDYYRSKRESGVRHFTALRCLAQRWIKIIHKIWRERIPYDEAVHQANKLEGMLKPAKSAA